MRFEMKRKRYVIKRIVYEYYEVFAKNKKEALKKEVYDPFEVNVKSEKIIEIEKDK